jgi:hypothetical protein
MADLPNHDEVQRSFESFSDFDTKDDATAGQGINDRGLATVQHQSFRELLACICAIQKHGIPPPSRALFACGTPN